MTRIRTRVTAAALAAAATFGVTACGGGSGLSGTTVTSHNLTVQQIAKANDLTRVTMCQNGELYTVSAGIAYDGSVKYGIDTFASSRARDAWLDVAKNMGGFPSTYKQGGTWVLYRAEDQSPGCGD